MNDFVFSLLLLGALSSGDGMPFWMTANQYGLMPSYDGGLALVGAHTSYDESDTFQWRWGASLGASYYNDETASTSFHPFFDELYGSAKWKVFSIDVGMKRREMDFLAQGGLGSLSVTGGHIVESGNARTMPGYNLILDPVAVPFTGKHVWIFGEFGDYKTLDDRYVIDALIHRTKAFMRFDFTSRFSLTLGLDHYALWGGTSPKYGAMPITFDNYFRVITGSRASSSGTINDQMNVIGDQGGGELIRFDYRGDGFKVAFQHDIPYADGSGMGFQNFPDGVNTLWFGFDSKDKWVSDILYEYHYTMDQSGDAHDRPATQKEIDSGKAWQNRKGEWRKTIGGRDSYFTNGEYRSGWTYYGRTIGDPLFITGFSTDCIKVVSTRFKAHHIGIAGKLFRKAPYKLMLTYSDNYGNYGEPETSRFYKPLKQVSGAFTGEIPRLFKVNGLALTYGLYADKGSVYEDQFGCILGVKYLIGK